MKKIFLAACFFICYATLSCADDKLSVDEIRWLNRLSYGVNSATVNDYQALGKAAFLQAQLHPDNENELPSDVIDLIEESTDDSPIKTLVENYQAEQKRIKSLPIAERPEENKQLRKDAEKKVSDLAQRHVLRALYSPAQLKEQMVWFWFNHFSIFKNKGPLVKLVIADYEEQAIRPHALGNFRDLLHATLQHPAMLMYLDNAKNGANKINENYARELMELHTMGVDAGYSQQDVQELARILTGVGVNWTDKTPKLKKDWQALYVYKDGFEFNPARHDFGKKVFLNQTIEGQGFAEVEQVLDMLVKHPATAHFISRKLATYFVSDNPSEQLIAQTAKTFQDSHGDIAKTLQTLFASAEFNQSLGKKYSDPQHYVLATTRFVYDGQIITNVKPLITALQKLGEPLYAHLTPDGYGMTEKDWVSQGQLFNRFQIAKNMARHNPKLFEEQENDGAFAGLLEMFSDMADKKVVMPKLTTPLFHQAVEPLLSEPTKAVLNKAANAQEWNSLLLSSPEFFYR